MVNLGYSKSTLGGRDQFLMVHRNSISGLPSLNEKKKNKCHQHYFNWICHGWLEQGVFLSRGWQQLFMVSICALDHCLGRSASKEGSRNPKLRKQIKAGWEAETLIYSNEDRCLHRRWSGSATSKPCTTGTYWRYSRHTGIHAGYRTHGVRTAVGIVTILQ